MAETADNRAAAALERQTGPAPSPVPEVSVVIPHYNDLDNLKVCLGKLAAQTLPRSKFEIIVADNLSDCGLAAVEAACGDLARVILAPIRGPGPARNAGVEAARAEALAFTDTDCSPEPGWLEGGLKALQRFDIVGGQIEVTVADPERPTDVECFEKVFAFNNRKYVEEQNYTAAATLFTTKAAFAKVGGFPGTTVSEDRDWCRRAVKAGFTLGYTPDAVVAHPAREDWEQLLKKRHRQTRHQFYEARQEGHGLAHWILFNFVVLLSPVGHVFTVLRSDRLDTFGQKLGAIRVLIRLRAWRFAEGMRIAFSRKIEDPWFRENANGEN